MKNQTKIIEEMTTERIVEWWGSKHTGRDYLSEYIDGDGEQLLYLQTASSRPWGWLVKVDSSRSNENEDAFYEFLEELWEELEFEFGSMDDYVEEDDERYAHPVVNTDGGYTWDFITQ